MDKSMDVYEKFLKSEATKRTYLHYFNRFLKWVQENGNESITPDKLLELDNKTLQMHIEDYILNRRKTLSPSSLPAIIASLEHFFGMNDKDLQFKRIRKMIPPFTKKAGNNAWSTDDIQKMLRNSCSNRDRAFIHVLASTGCRIGALEALKWKNVLPMKENCRAVLFYEGSNEEYWGFLTPEACTAIDEYIDERRRDGEMIEQESPLFRSAYQIGAQKVKPMSTASAKMIALRLAKSVKRNKVGRRYDTMSAHGFRKRFNTILKSNDKANPSLIEKIMGHRGVFSLDGSYLKPTIPVLFDEFQKHILNLTVDGSERDKITITNFEKEKLQTSFRKEEFENVKELYKTDHQLLQILVHTLSGAGVQLVKPNGQPFEIDPSVIQEAQSYIVKHVEDLSLQQIGNNVSQKDFTF